MSNPCVKTGARVLVTEYGGVAPADLFLVGGTIIARFGCGNRIDLDYSPEALEYASHRMTIGTRGWYRQDLGVAAVPVDQLTGELVLGMRNVQAADLAKRLARPTATCPHCAGAGSLDIAHPSGDPQLETSATCDQCAGIGEVEVDAGVVTQLEDRIAELEGDLTRCRNALTTRSPQ